MEIERIVELATEYYDKDYRKRGFALYKKAAELGYAKAQRVVADCYRFGLGTKKDGTEAARWYQKAAEQDDLHSIYALVCFYMWGDYGMEKNTEMTVEPWRKAAESGDATAQFSLGNLYLEGLYVEQNREEAIRWYRKSAQQGHKTAREKLLTLGVEDCE